MAHTKAGGSTQLGRDSVSKRLGIKVFGGQPVKAGGIIVRQRGTKFRAGENVKRAEDDSLFALAAGVVQFRTRKIRKFNGRLEAAQFVHVEMQS